MDQFIAERALHLAIVFLTRRDDLLVTRTSSAEAGADLVCSLCENGEPTGRKFGVRLQARTDIPSSRDLLQARLTPTEALPLPVLQFVFSMEDDTGFYMWLTNPRDTSILQPDTWTPLETSQLSSIVETASAWYAHAQQHHDPTPATDRRIAGVELPREKRIEIGLTYIFGIGRATARKLLKQAGIDPDRRVHQLSDAEIAKLRQLIDTSVRVEGVLRSEIARNIERLMGIGHVRDTRLPRGRSDRGPTARSREGVRRVSAGKKKPQTP